MSRKQYRIAWRSLNLEVHRGPWLYDRKVVVDFCLHGNREGVLIVPPRECDLPAIPRLAGGMIHWVEQREEPTPLEELATAACPQPVTSSVPADDLISRVLHDRIEATLVQHSAIQTTTYNGNDFDIRSHFVVLWKRDMTRGVAGKESWGTHRGTIRGPINELRADIYSGEYDLDEEEARKHFRDNQPGLY